MNIWLVSLLSPIVKAHIFLNIKSDSWLSYREEMTIWTHYSFYVFSSANCRNPLGLESRKIPDGALWASSAFNKDFSMFGPQRARLRLDQPPRGYRADASSVDTNGSYITVDLGNETVVTGVSTQGYGDTTVQEWVTKYNLMFLNGIDFSPFKETSGATRVRQFIICMAKTF